jgi:hypothetical protein
MSTPLTVHDFNLDTEWYSAADGRTIRREHGLSPNGNPLCGRWVLREADGTFVDYDQYRYDLFSMHDFTADPAIE